MARPGLCQHRQKPRGPGTALEPGAQSGCGTGDLLWALPSPVPPAIPPLVTMGTLGCDPAPRLTTAPLGRRATECQIPETGLRKTCGMATLGMATSGDGTCRLWGRGMVGGPFPEPPRGPQAPRPPLSAQEGGCERRGSCTLLGAEGTAASGAQTPGNRRPSQSAHGSASRTFRLRH